MSKSCDTNSDCREKRLPDVTATTMTDRPPFATHRHFLLIAIFLYMYSNGKPYNINLMFIQFFHIMNF
ncbi:hypothetical protein V1478_006868 [Vespula squamosa]|uniref:Uncharacterized protein n=1 Tax=Vespula squamosa TaxID=30214 RepID=A0ABD2B1K6_VESSQ